MNIDPEWTLEQALEANRAATSQDPGRGIGDPTLPLPRWIATQDLKSIRIRFESGEPAALLDAIHVCAVHSLPMPEWLELGYLDAYRSVRWKAEKKSWDDVFGAPFPKGTHVRRIQRDQHYKWKVYAAVTQRREEGWPTDEGLFEDVADELGLKKTHVSELYYQVKHMFDSPPEIVKALLAAKP